MDPGILKAVGLVGLLNLLLQKAERWADFGEIPLFDGEPQSYQGAKLWNGFSKEAQNTSTLKNFMKALQRSFVHEETSFCFPYR